MFAEVILLAVPVYGNMRKPFYLSALPSSAIQIPPEVTVLGERLRFTCDPIEALESRDVDRLQNDPSLSGRCHIRAEYRIQSDRALLARFELLLPSDAMVEITAGEKRRIRPQPERTPRKYTGWSPQGYDYSESAPVFNAEFEGGLLAGENLISVEYDQLLSAGEEDFGYFRTGRFIRSFTYFLWPLKEWTLDPDFQLEIEVIYPEPGFLAGLFGSKHQRPVCGDLKPESGAGFKSDRRVSFRFGRDFPDMFYCSFDED
jgi:hypothetical protein